MIFFFQKYFCKFEALVDRWAGYYFDWNYGVKTEGQVWPDQFGVLSTSIIYSKRYQPTHISVMKRALNNLPIAPSDYHFYDFGHGKGRMLIAAALAGFKTINGIEFSPLLFDLSKKNVESFRNHFPNQASAILLHFGDALEFKINSEANIYFFYNPFGGKVLRAVLENILSTSPSLSLDLFVFVNLQEPFLLELLGLREVAVLDHRDHNRVIRYYKAISS